MDDYSYVVNDAQITCTTIGKFCSIAAMTRINPGNHPMHRGHAGALHLSRPAPIFPCEADDAAFFAWRREAPRFISATNVLDRTWRGDPAGPQHRHRSRGRRRARS